MIDKVTRVLPNSTLFKSNSMYPRRYFDDLVLESKITEQKILTSFDNRFKGTGNASKVLQEMMSSRMPFGVIKGKQSLNEESSTILPNRQTA